MDQENSAQRGKPLLVFDGVCVLCSRLLRLVLWADATGETIDIATAQSQVGQEILKKFHLDGDDFKTVLLVMPDGRFFTKIDVVIEIARLFDGVWKVFHALKIIPRPFRDSLYDFIAQRRYRIFGKSAYCALIPDRYKDRIIR